MTFVILFFYSRDFSDVWPPLVSAFKVDRLLKRTFLHAIPVWRLHELVSTRMFHISDLCVALIEFLPRGFWGKKEVVTNDHCNNIYMYTLWLTDVKTAEWRLLSIKKRQFSIYKTCFEIFMSSVSNELFNGCIFGFYIKVRYKFTPQNLRYNLNMTYAENKNSAHNRNNKIKDKREQHN